VTELEHACSTSLFDYSAVQVLVDELLLVLPQLPLSEALTAQVRVLSSAVEITSGLGQVELWTALRPRIMDPALQSVLHTLCDQVDSIADHSALSHSLSVQADFFPGLRASILQAVSLASEQTASLELSQLEDLTSGVPRVSLVDRLIRPSQRLTYVRLKSTMLPGKILRPQVFLSLDT
jgi:hypothetical protein